jgi:hypothetical protein
LLLLAKIKNTHPSAVLPFSEKLHTTLDVKRKTTITTKVIIRYSPCLTVVQTVPPETTIHRRDYRAYPHEVYRRRLAHASTLLVLLRVLKAVDALVLKSKQLQSISLVDRTR